VTPPAAPPEVDFTLYLVTDRHQTRSRSLATVVEEALAAGVQAVQLREKDLNSRDLYELAYELRKLTTRYGARLLINDRLDIAQAVEADGVHLGGNSLPIYRARQILGRRMLIGVSCHNQVNAITAQEKGADFITFGPVYFTPSKAQYGAPVGLDKLQNLAQIVRIPVFAIGGITPATARAAIDAGASGIALISAILAAESPGSEARSLLSLLPVPAPHTAAHV
jgi:thiamine-phosphate pyrophosphorylase